MVYDPEPYDEDKDHMGSMYTLTVLCLPNESHVTKVILLCFVSSLWLFTYAVEIYRFCM